MAYVYRHIRLDENEPFYIGIGSDEKYKRAFERTRRNTHWNRIANVSSYEVEILMYDLTWEQACKKEIEFIELYGRRDLNTGTLVNLTGGGDGAYKTFPSLETRKKLSDKAKGKIYKQITKNRISSTLKELYRDSENHPRSKKVICLNSGKIYSSIKDAAKDNSINAKYLRKYLSGEHKNNTTLRYY